MFAAIPCIFIPPYARAYTERYDSLGNIECKTNIQLSALYSSSMMGYDCADSYGNFYCANYHKFPRNFISKLRPTSRLPAVSAFCSEPQREGGGADESGLTDRTISSRKKKLTVGPGHFRQVFRSSKILREITLPIVLCAISDVCRGEVFPPQYRRSRPFGKRA